MATIEERVKQRYPKAFAEEWPIIDSSSNTYVTIWMHEKPAINALAPAPGLIGMGMDEPSAWYDALKTIYMNEAPHLLKDLKRTL